MLKLVFAVVLALVALQGLRVLTRAVRGLQQARASSQWPKTEGTVNRNDEIRNDVAYSARAVVRYTAAGKPYSTDLISFGQTLSPFDRSEAGLQRVRYPEGSKVSVSYSPAKPSVAVLHPGVHSEDFWPLGVAVAYLLPAVLCLRLTLGAPFGGASAIAAIAAMLFAGLICGLGVLAIAGGLQKMYYACDSPNWPVTPGEVTVNVGTQAMMYRGSKGDYTVYSPGFLYRYELDGATHVNFVRRFRSVKRTGEEEAKTIAPEELPVGTKVSVRYLPVDPDISALDTGVDGAAFILPGIGIAVLCFGLAALVSFVPSLLRN